MNETRFLEIAGRQWTRSRDTKAGPQRGAREHGAGSCGNYARDALGGWRELRPESFKGSTLQQTGLERDSKYKGRIRNEPTAGHSLENLDKDFDLTTSAAEQLPTCEAPT